MFPQYMANMIFSFLLIFSSCVETISGEPVARFSATTLQIASQQRNTCLTETLNTNTFSRILGYLI